MDKYEELVKNLRELIDMWTEVSTLDGFLRVSTHPKATRMDCINDLTEILDGNLSCIERIEGKTDG